VPYGNRLGKPRSKASDAGTAPSARTVTRAGRVASFAFLTNWSSIDSRPFAGSRTDTRETEQTDGVQNDAM
jgi:hypothetical protein